MKDFIVVRQLQNLANTATVRTLTMRISKGILRSAFRRYAEFRLSPKRATPCWALVVVASVALAGNANAATMVMDFGSAVTGGITPATFTQNGITMDKIYGHFDIYGDTVGGTPADNVAAVHNGNGGEGVTFAYSGGAFDLLSVDVTGFLIRGAGNSDFLTGTFTSDLGGIYTVTGNKNDASAGVGVIDFSAEGALWLGINGFTLTVPRGVGPCSATCDILGFDDVTIADPSVVPVPAAVWLFGTALIGLVGFSKQRKVT